MKVYKLYFGDKLLDIISENMDRDYLTPNTQTPGDEEFLRTYSEYNYYFNSDKIKDYFLHSLIDKHKVESISTQSEEERNRIEREQNELLKTCSSHSNGATIGIGYSITDISVNGSMKIDLRVSKHFDLEESDTIPHLCMNNETCQDIFMINQDLGIYISVLELN